MRDQGRLLPIRRDRARKRERERERELMLFTFKGVKQSFEKELLYIKGLFEKLNRYTK